MQKCTLTPGNPLLAGIDLDLPVEVDVLSLDEADAGDESRVEREVGRGGDARDFARLPVDDAGEDQRQAEAGVHFFIIPPPLTRSNRASEPNRWTSSMGEDQAVENFLCRKLPLPRWCLSFGLRAAR